MRSRKPDKQPDKLPATRSPEALSLMEPLVLASDSRHRPDLIDLAFRLTAKSASLRSRLPEGVLKALSELVRTMNCYYSNLIEGHDTHPIEIEKAMKNDYSKDRKKRDLQLEAKAHVIVQAWIDDSTLSAKHAVTFDGITEIHRRFCENLPVDLLSVVDKDTGKQHEILPGALRTRDVLVGRHVAISPGSVRRFLDRYEQIYSNLGPVETVLATAAAHHRLLWIHPFLDGNGRVARLVSYAQLRDTLNTGGVWSVARGLARRVEEYKAHLANCDNTRRNDLDGRGHLSEEALVAFTRFFLETCIDQVEFMERLVQPARLHERIMSWAEEEFHSDKSLRNASNVLEAVLFRGELPRADVYTLTQVGERQSQRIVSELMKRQVLTSNTHKSPLRLAFPAALAAQWMPGLFPEHPAV